MDRQKYVGAVIFTEVDDVLPNQAPVKCVEAQAIPRENGKLLLNRTNQKKPQLLLQNATDHNMVIVIEDIDTNDQTRPPQFGVFGGVPGQPHRIVLAAQKSHTIPMLIATGGGSANGGKMRWQGATIDIDFVSPPGMACTRVGVRSFPPDVIVEC